MNSPTPPNEKKPCCEDCAFLGMGGKDCACHAPQPQTEEKWDYLERRDGHFLFRRGYMAINIPERDISDAITGAYEDGKKAERSRIEKLMEWMRKPPGMNDKTFGHNMAIQAVLKALSEESKGV